MKTFFTSDHHFGHKSILQHQAETRPFENTHEMNVVYTDIWNKTIDQDDVVYHLGDLCLGSLYNAKNYISRLNGVIKLIPGNHDRWIRDFSKREEDILSASGHPLEILHNLYEVKIDGIMTVLCHYPMRSWRASYHGTWHLYGHVHRNLEPWGMSMDVGVDGAQGIPYSEEQIITYMHERKKQLEAMEVIKPEWHTSLESPS